MAQGWSGIISTCSRGVKPNFLNQIGPKKGDFSKIMVISISFYILEWWSWAVIKPARLMTAYDHHSIKKGIKMVIGSHQTCSLHDCPWPSFQYIETDRNDHHFWKISHFWPFFGQKNGFNTSRACRYDAKSPLSHQNQSSLLKIWNGPGIPL